MSRSLNKKGPVYTQPCKSKMWSDCPGIQQGVCKSAVFTVGDEVTVTVAGSIPGGSRALSAAGVGTTGKTPANSIEFVGSVVWTIVGAGSVLTGAGGGEEAGGEFGGGDEVAGGGLFAARSSFPVATMFVGDAARMPLPTAL